MTTLISDPSHLSTPQQLIRQFQDCKDCEDTLARCDDRSIHHRSDQTSLSHFPRLSPLSRPALTCSSSVAMRDIELNRPRKRHPMSSKICNPEALVNDEDWWIHCLRIILMVTLVVVAIGISVTTYKLMTKFEYESFRNEFETVASSITRAFLRDLQLKLWVSSFVTVAVSKKTTAVDGNILDANTEFLDKLSLGVGSLTYWSRIGFSPLLWTQDERHQWEDYARKNFQGKATNVCHVCGMGMEMGNPTSNANIPGYGIIPCALINQAGLNGAVPEKGCLTIPALIKNDCQCKPVPPSAAQHGLNGNFNMSALMATEIFQIENGQRVTDSGPPPFIPVWQAAPQPIDGAVMFNQMSDPLRRQAIQTMIETKLPTFSPTRYPDGEYQHVSGESLSSPSVTIFLPLVDQNSTSNHSVVGLIAIDMTWATVLGFSNDIPQRSSGVVFVIENTIGQAFTFQIDDLLEVTFVGEGDLHDRKYDNNMVQSSADDLKAAILMAAPQIRTQVPDTALLYKIRTYASDEFKAKFLTTNPLYFTVAVASIFVFTSAIFFTYDVFVRRRQIKVMQAALQSNALVTSVFPEFVTSRLMMNANAMQRLSSENLNVNNRRFSALPFGTPKHQLTVLLGTRSPVEHVAFNDSEPIADFFPNVTVLFADIAGFTAWSSEREPVQVFQLLESVYQMFDTIAVKHGVFKVETIGDCYVAVIGLPVAQPDHAVKMTRFAYEIMLRMHDLASSLESLLGPGTGSLSIRVGLHSGSVTGGVLRGDKARFQLFGDTMNTASRMESTGEVDMIQASDSTAGLLKEAGYDDWVEERDEKVLVKGKGDMQTFWIDPERQEASTTGFVQAGSDIETLPASVTRNGSSSDSLDRLVNWNADLLERFLKKVVATRKAANRRHQRRASNLSTSFGSRNPINDVTEVLEMYKFCEKTADEQLEPEAVELDEAVQDQLRDYVDCIAEMYRKNPFHNFEHASHVAMSANKILKRIIKPEGIDYRQELVNMKDRKKVVAHQIHDSTFGISSDALMQFAAIFSALIHDVDHNGVSNAQLVKEKNEVAIKYNGKCVAEQNSVHIAWDLLMEDRFCDLRGCIYTTAEEKSRFRQLIVNAVIATDIADSGLQTLRKNRWYKAFSDDSDRPSSKRRVVEDGISYKATVVFEYIIQASDVAHTMQHWHVYNRWNKRLFKERYTAFLDGREEKDPSVGWYNGEIWFFDNYIIPLARKLETCGVFGVSSDEYLNYALANRREWERRGLQLVEEMKERCSQQNLHRSSSVLEADCPNVLLVRADIEQGVAEDYEGPTQMLSVPSSA